MKASHRLNALHIRVKGPGYEMESWTRWPGTMFLEYWSQPQLGDHFSFLVCVDVASWFLFPTPIKFLFWIPREFVYQRQIYYCVNTPAARTNDVDDLPLVDEDPDKPNDSLFSFRSMTGLRKSTQKLPPLELFFILIFIVCNKRSQQTDKATLIRKSQDKLQCLLFHVSVDVLARSKKEYSNWSLSSHLSRWSTTS